MSDKNTEYEHVVSRINHFPFWVSISCSIPKEELSENNMRVFHNILGACSTGILMEVAALMLCSTKDDDMKSFKRMLSEFSMVVMRHSLICGLEGMGDILEGWD